MATQPETLPALPDSVPTTVDLDGWDVDECLGALRSWGRAMPTVRHAIGLVLWKLGSLVADGVYGQHVAELADAYGVDVGTLRRWRNAAETAEGLPAPSASIAARRQAQTPLRANARSQPPAKPLRANARSRPERVTPTAVIPPARPAQLSLFDTGDLVADLVGRGSSALEGCDMATLVALAAMTRKALAAQRPTRTRDVTPRFKKVEPGPRGSRRPTGG